MKLQGQVAVVTGASSGVGYETARSLARAGAVVVVAARRFDRLDWLVGEIRAEGGQALSVPTDVTEPAQVQRLFDTAINVLGRVDILINSAGVVQKIAPLEQWSNADFNTVMRTNVHGVFYAARAVIPHMKQRRSGIIVNLGSRVGKVGVANIAPFCAAKFALTGLSQAMALELRPYNVYVTTLFPGMINTDIHPLNPPEELRQQLMSAADVAEAIVWVCSLPPSLRVDELPLMPRQMEL